MRQARDFNHWRLLYSHSDAAAALFMRANTPLRSLRKASAAGNFGIIDPAAGTRNA
jgi:hypothetical protein